MKKESIEEIVYKEEVTSLLLLWLQAAAHEVRGESDFEEAYRKRLKFQKQTDWKKYKACIDLLDDTEYAIMNAFEYQLGDIKNTNSDIGEIYIRLYGILNAVYLQMRAYEIIANLLNYPDRAELPRIFRELKIYKLRGIAGAHTVDYLHDEETTKSKPDIEKTASFRLIQQDLDKTGKRIWVLDENDIRFDFNLLDILMEYEKFARELLINLINHSIATLGKNKTQKTEVRNRLKDMLPNLIDYSKINKNQYL